MTQMSVEEYRALQVAEYGRYVAKGPIHINGVLAFNKGDAVPVGHVEREVVPLEQVEERQDPDAPTTDGQAAGGTQAPPPGEGGTPAGDQTAVTLTPPAPKKATTTAVVDEKKDV